jgi:hypothetical protein
LYYLIRTSFVHKNWGVNLGSLLWSAVSLTPLCAKKVDFIVKYLREYEAICKKGHKKKNNTNAGFYGCYSVYLVAQKCPLESVKE